MWLVDDGDDEHAATFARPYCRTGALGLPMRHLARVRMSADTTLGVSKARHLGL